MQCSWTDFSSSILIFPFGIITVFKRLSLAYCDDCGLYFILETAATIREEKYSGLFIGQLATGWKAEIQLSVLLSSSQLAVTHPSSYSVGKADRT